MAILLNIMRTSFKFLFFFSKDTHPHIVLCCVVCGVKIFETGFFLRVFFSFFFSFIHFWWFCLRCYLRSTRQSIYNVRQFFQIINYTSTTHLILSFICSLVTFATFYQLLSIIAFNMIILYMEGGRQSVLFSSRFAIKKKIYIITHFTITHIHLIKHIVYGESVNIEQSRTEQWTKEKTEFRY